ncbi:MAG: histidine phosphatase family protein [Gemmatimonadetes bacterium]|nr:histidine phosphatase family protein [Gemmatimonadota bacterium]MBT5143102.1 histidine phosphatase family protein [Gemmatimonadota bacterium]MBT5588367.1 histidine phosphatase family protein [Gemmatimonadota bacterium]MBT5963527.1 histidine phosphatase family protein [Gemmatimonadota bacterium]MBT7597345.1 histidine phosphatase family protein [Gemmatimonadota bacterium]
METLLICLRHAEQETPIWEPQADGVPREPDPPLSKKGCQQAEAVARTLHGTRPCQVFVSSAARSQQTGEIIASHLGVGVEVVPDLVEASMGFGPWAPGQRGDVLESWITGSDLNAQLPAGEAGLQVKARMERALGAIASQCQDAPGIVVGHVASLTVGIGSLCQNGPTLLGRPLEHATPFEFRHGHEGWHVEWPVPEVGSHD